jgi:hypothetical protein
VAKWTKEEEGAATPLLREKRKEEKENQLLRREGKWRTRWRGRGEVAGGKTVSLPPPLGIAAQKQWKTSLRRWRELHEKLLSRERRECFFFFFFFLF